MHMLDRRRLGMQQVITTGTLNCRESEMQTRRQKDKYATPLKYKQTMLAVQLEYPQQTLWPAKPDIQHSPVERDLLGLDLTVLDINLVTTQHNGNVFTYPAQHPAHDVKKFVSSENEHGYEWSSRTCRGLCAM